jgi:hypothetical protein
MIANKIVAIFNAMDYYFESAGVHQKRRGENH